MEEPPITSTERDPGIGWVLPPPKSSSADRPPWAIPTLIVGFGCSLIVGVVSLQYSKGQMNGDSPSLAMAYAFMLGPFLLAGVPLMLIGSLATIRPWSTRMRWLRWVASAVVVLWFGLLLQGPGLLFQKPISRGTATVGGLPGHAATWSGAVDCIWARGVVDKAVAMVPAMPPGGGAGFELTVWPTRDDPYLMVWVGEFGRQTETDTIEQTSDGAQGSITAEAGPLLDIDGLHSVITMTWDCGRAPTG